MNEPTSQADVSSAVRSGACPKCGERARTGDLRIAFGGPAAEKDGDHRSTRVFCRACGLDLIAVGEPLLGLAIFVEDEHHGIDPEFLPSAVAERLARALTTADAVKAVLEAEYALSGKIGDADPLSTVNAKIARLVDVLGEEEGES